MEIRRQCQQNLGQVIKKKVQDKNAQQKVAHLQQPLKAIGDFAGRLNHPAQAGCTKNFIGMLRDALPAEKTATLGTARNRLPLPMIMTTLVSDIGHIYIKIDPVIIVNSFARSYQYV
jgi:hypothetical protein